MKDDSIKIKIIRSEIEEPALKIFDHQSAGYVWRKIAKICLYVLAGFLPLFFLPLTIAPLEINKQTLAIVLALAAFLCYLIDCLSRRTITYPKSLLSLAVLVLLLFTGISAFISPASENAIFGNFIQPDAFFTFLIAGLIFFLAAVYIKKDDLKRMAVCFFAGLVLTTVFGLLQIFGKFILPWDFSRSSVFNSIGSISSWGIFIGFGLVLIVAALINLELSKRRKIILAIAGLLMFFGLIVLNIQMLWLGLALAMFCLLLLKFVGRAEINLPLIIIILSLFLILIGGRLPSLGNVGVEVRPSISATLSIVKGTFSGAKHILLGSGPASFGYEWRLFKPAALNQTVFWSVTFNQGVSFALTLLITLGIGGILSLMFLIFAFVREIFRKLPLINSSQIIIAAGALYLLFNLFIFPLFFAQLFFIFLLLGIFISGSEKNYEIDFYSGSKSRRVKGLIVFLAAIFSLILVFFAVYIVSQKYVAAVYYQKGILSSSLDNSIDDFNQSVVLDPKNDAYLRALSNVLSLKANQIGSTPASADNTQNLSGQLQNAIVSAVNIGVQATKVNPLDSLNWSNLGNIYENLIPISGAEALAEENYNKALGLDPQGPQGFVDLARMWIVSADRSQQKDAAWQEKLNKAQGYLEKVIGLKSDYAAAHFLLAQIYYREGNMNATIGKIADLISISPSDPGLFFQLGILYYRDGRISQAQNAFEKALGLDQNYSNARYFLGLIYDDAGQKQKATEQFEKIQALNPDNQEVKNILDNLKNGKSALSGLVPPAQPPAERTETLVKSGKQ